VFDYEKEITRECVDLDAYEEKFCFVDKVLSLSNPHPKYWVRINSDPTMKIYAFFRIDGKPLKLYPYQDLIINDTHRFKYFRAANQIGKSIYLDVDAAVDFITDHGHAHNAAIVSKSLPQSTHQMRRVKSLLNSMTGLAWQDDKGSSDNMSIITLDIKDDLGKVKYTNMIICAPCTEGLLGYDLHKLYLDEFEFWEVDTEHFFYQVAQPRTYHTKGAIIITTNPNGADSFGAVLEKQRLRNGERKWHVYEFNYLDKPGNTIDEYEELRAELPRAKFESTVAAIRTISDRNWFSSEEIEASKDSTLDERKMVGHQPFFFLDVGAKKDHSVLVGGFVVPDEYNDKFKHLFIPIIHQYPAGYPLSMVVGVEDDDGTVTSGWHKEKSVKDYLLEWGADGTIPVFGVDVTGNSGISPLFNATDIFPVDITFSGPAKSGMYQRFKYYMEKKLLHRIPHKAFEHEASHLQVKKSARGYLMIHHENEDDHDDVMDAVAGLVHLTDNPNIFPPSVTSVAHNKPKKTNEEEHKPTTSGEVDAYIAKTISENNSFNKTKTYGGMSTW
jgi:hypothetical protein